MARNGFVLINGLGIPQFLMLEGVSHAGGRAWLCFDKHSDGSRTPVDDLFKV